uniref:RING-type E3 ubiquitin transferase n=1 Tax=Kalanchoe fedtschenkoi TaxID=63787 RepID=A0A7N0U766_KALFE
MAKTDASDTDPRKRVDAMELKRELKRLVEAIVGDEDNGDGVCEDQASKVLGALREMKSRKSGSICLGTVCVPEEFRCPISKQLMGDPVVLSTGKSYDRPFIQKWLKEGHRTCPVTQQVLSHTILTPNLLVRELIAKWCVNNGIAPPKPVTALDEELVTDAERDRLKLLLEKMSSSLPVQKEAARELRLLTKRMPSFRALFGESADAIPQLLNPLSPGGGVDTDSDLQEDLVTTVLNLSIHDSNKKLVGENPIVIPLLIESLKGKTVEIKRNAAAALFTLSALDSNKQIIGKKGAMEPLIELLDEGHPLAIKDAASAIFNLCILSENKVRAIRDGAIQAILKKIRDQTLVEELLAILAMLSGHREAVEEMCAHGAVGCLLSILRESQCERNKENCVVILYTICYYDRSRLRQVREEEDDYATISKVAQFGTSRAQRKANGILERLHKVTSVTHTT